MELADTSLDKELDNLSKNHNRALLLFKQICEGVKFLHEKKDKIVHRDLKPANILIKNNVAKICDLGEAKVFLEKDAELSRRDGFGTYEYLAPEIFQGMENINNKYDEKNDVWALGIIFHKMLTKKHPFLEGVKFTEANKQDTIKTILTKNDLTVDSSVKDPKLLKILNGCLQKNPMERLSITDVLKIIDINALDESEILNEATNKEFLLELFECKKIRKELIYSALRDGFKAEDFHRLCDNKGPTLILIKSKNSCYFGGFSSIPWESPQIMTNKKATGSFLFSLDKKTKHPLINQNDEYAIECDKDFGPIFGNGADLFILENEGAAGLGRSYESEKSYKYPESECYFTGNNKIEISNYEVFSIDFLA